MAKRLLLVDDDPVIRESLSEALADDGIEVRTADSAEQALTMLGDGAPDIVLSDVRMTGLDGLELLRLLRERVPDLPIVLMTAFDDMPTVVTAMRDGAVDFLTKPLDLHELRRVLARIFDDLRTRQHSRVVTPDGSAHRRTDELIGHDPAMIAIYKQVGQVAVSRETVLIRGESGTGKEVIAHAIHNNSPHAAEPFVAVNCSALPTTLLESELFGHVRGAFTDAHTARRGRFALAGRGTIFLDEIGDTTPEFQSKLLRVLQERDFYPVGAERAERTEARVIAATHQKLEDMVARREFREDLYYRLRVVEITVPPLRERRGDIPLLARHLVARASERAGHEPPVLSRDTLDMLMRHEWPGNVRELENCLARAVVLARGEVIRAEHIAIAPRGSDGAAPLPTLEQLERTHVERVLAATQGHKARAAQILGISRPRLDRLLTKYEAESGGRQSRQRATGNGELERLQQALGERYVVERELARGGMATVYLASEQHPRRTVAIKVFDPSVSARMGEQRFNREIELASNLAHPGIVAIYAAGEADGLLYYVMPYIEGETLRERLDREGPLPIDDVLRIVRDVADALDYAHRHRVVHRDIKPQNILLHEARAFVADFGVAKAVYAGRGGSLTEEGHSVGTPEYMSPEQILGEETIDARSDIYSLGCVVYEMLAGEPPFRGKTLQSTLSRQLSDMPSPLRTLRQTVPDTVDLAVMRALAKTPADRFHSVADFAQSLVSPLHPA